MVNLAGAKVQYSKDKQNAAVRNMSGGSDRLDRPYCAHYSDCCCHFSLLLVFVLIQNTFSICTKYRGILLQAREREVGEWLYALDPLLAGSIK